MNKERYMQVFIIWIFICVLNIILGEVVGYRVDKYLFGMLMAITMWLPAMIIDKLIRLFDKPAQIPSDKTEIMYDTSLQEQEQ